MNSPPVYSMAKAGSKIDAPYVSPLHGIDRTSINISNFFLQPSPLQNNSVKKKLDMYHFAIEKINFAVENPPPQSEELIIDVSTPPKNVSFQPLASPQSTRRRRQSLLVIEALESISSVSKTPTKLKIRNSTAFSGSATKKRMEAVGAKGLSPPTPANDYDLCKLLEACIGFEAAEADKEEAELIQLQPWSAEDAALLAYGTSARPAVLATTPPTSSPKLKSLKAMQADGRFSSPLHVNDENISDNITSHHNTIINTGSKNSIPAFNSPPSKSVSANAIASSSKRFRRLSSVMDSCTKLLQDIDHLSL